MSSSRSTNLIAALLAVLATAGTLAAANPIHEVSLGVNKPKPDVAPWEFSVEYGVNTDFNRTEEPRAYYNKLDLSVSKEFWGPYTGVLSGGLNYMSLDNAVTRATNRDEYFTYRDLTVTVMRTWKSQDLNHSLAGMVGQDILLSEESRFLGYKSVTSGQAIYTWSPNKRFSLKNTLLGGYILNTYKYAPVTAGRSIRKNQINPDGYYGYAVGPMVTLMKGLKIGASLVVRGTHYLDNSNLYDFGNHFSLTYSRGAWMAYTRYVNRGWADRGETNLWFADNYRRLLQAGAVYNF